MSGGVTHPSVGPIMNLHGGGFAHAVRRVALSRNPSSEAFQATRSCAAVCHSSCIPQTFWIGSSYIRPLRPREPNVGAPGRWLGNAVLGWFICTSPLANATRLPTIARALAATPLPHGPPISICSPIMCYSRAVHVILVPRPCWLPLCRSGLLGRCSGLRRSHVARALHGARHQEVALRRHATASATQSAHAQATQASPRGLSKSGAK